MSSASTSTLFQPKQVGKLNLQHRIVLSPTTRFRADDNHVPLPLVAEYYNQRSSVPGSLLITEATAIAPRAAGYPNIPGIWSEDQINSWSKVTEAVHANGSFIYLQLWALGRAADPEQLQKEDPSLSYISASDIPMSDGRPAPKPLTFAEIQEYPPLYAQAARNAIRAGFDGIEIHGANGYLINQFIDDTTNKREDIYGGSIENRSRFALEVTDAVVNAIGEDRTAIRFSPWGTFNDMGMEDPIPTYTYLVNELKERYPNLSYLHIVEPRSYIHVIGPQSQSDGTSQNAHRDESNDFIRALWNPKPLITAGGYERDTAIKVADEKGDLIGFSRYYIANPDLPYRLKHNIPIHKGDRSKYYVYGSTDPAGYTDYPFIVPIAERLVD